MMTKSRATERVPLASAIILPTPEAEPIVGELRSSHDPAAGYGVPAHITLLYPFAPRPTVRNATGVLRAMFEQVPAFDFALVELRRFPATLYLHPEPAAAIARLTTLVAEQWPEFPPYGGAFSTIVPHLTVADHVGTDVMDMIRARIHGELPIRCRVAEAWLMCSDEYGMWSRSEVFRFRSRSGLSESPGPTG